MLAQREISPIDEKIYKNILLPLPFSFSHPVLDFWDILSHFLMEKSYHSMWQLRKLSTL